MRRPRPLPPFARSHAGALISRSAEIYTRGWAHLPWWRRYRALTWGSAAAFFLYAYDPFDWLGRQTARREFEEARAAAGALPYLTRARGDRFYYPAYQGGLDAAPGFRTAQSPPVPEGALPEDATAAEIIAYQRQKSSRF